MSTKLNPQALEANGRQMGITERSWCKAVSCGTGITVLAILASKAPDTTFLQNALRQLQITQPILRSRLHCTANASTFSFLTPPSPRIQLKSFDLSSTSRFLQTLPNSTNASLSPFHQILEHELGNNAWSGPCIDSAVLHASVYEMPGAKWVFTLRLHTAVCDRTTAASLLRELMALMGKREGGEQRQVGKGEGRDIDMGIEDLVPSERAKKPIWAHGLDMLGYSLNSLRLTNLKFKDVKRPRRSEVVRLKMNPNDTRRVLAGCESRGIKLCGALAAAGLIAAHSTKYSAHDPHRKKYAVVTLIDCRSELHPPLSPHHFGFYHSAILNTHAVRGGEKLWDLARRCYMALADSRNSNRHFSDMTDLNFLMCKAIDNPSLTASSSLRTSLICVFEDPVVDNANKMQQELGIEDYVGCSSVHGVGPSVALFDTIRDGWLDCACVYPAPLHSREQMQELVDNMKRALLDANKTCPE